MHQHRLEEQTRMIEYLKATNAPVSSLGRSGAQNRSPSPVAQNRSECSPGQLTPATADLPIAGHILCTHIHVHARSCTRMHVYADTQIQMHFHMDGCDRVCTVCMRACMYVRIYMHRCMYVSVYVSVCMCVCVCEYACMHACMHVCMNINVRMYSTQHDHGRHHRT